jgi:alcohol dehydrogenase class IV
LTFEHFQPVTLRFGGGERHRLPELLAQQRALIVTGRETLERSDSLHLLNEQVKRSSAVPPNPGDAEIDHLLSEAREHRAECVVGFGGGSAMDAAKVVAMLLGHWPNIAAYRARQASKPRITRLIQVATTAGTGSEVTRWASVWNDGVKSSVDEAAGFADIAIVDPELCHGMPPRLTLATGLDTMSHAMESLWGVHRSPLSEGYATKSLSLLAAHFEKACSGEADAETWEALALASTLAGLALSCTRSAAAHALSYELTGRFGVEHGLAVGLLCKSLLRWNQPAAPAGIAMIVEAMGQQSLEQVQDFIDTCFRRAGLSPNLSTFGIGREDFAAVVGQASSSNRLGNNPGQLDSAALLQVLETIA